MPQVGALDVAHRDEEAPVCLAGFVDRDDVRVVERGGELGLGQEPSPEVAVLSQFGGKELQGHLAAEPRVLCQLDDAHPAPPE